jgi:5-methylcytosine-specific restriction endonuclease McrA
MNGQQGGNRHRFLRQWLLAMHGPTCWYCGWPLTLDTSTLEHLKPRSKGGTHHRSNLRLACRVCNRNKADRLLSEVTVQARRGGGVCRRRRDVA